jgi:hypothetical protein
MIRQVLKVLVCETYRTVEHVLSLVSALLDMTLQGARVKRLEKLKAAEQLRRY